MLMRIRITAFIALASLSVVVSGAARGSPVLDTVAWTSDLNVDGTGTGTLVDSGITVTYFTVTAGNAGVTLPDNFANPASTGTAPAVPDGISNATAGVFGATVGGGPELEQIYFSSTVVNPTLLMNFTDATSSFVMQGSTLTLLSENNTQLAAGVLVTFTGSSNGFGDGFAATVNGTFGPSNPILLIDITTAPGGFVSQAFTIGVPVPEPASVVSGAMGALMIAGYAWRRRKPRAA